MPELSVADFSDWFRAVHGSDPFPWQQRLLETVASAGRWPKALDLPTGAGKTAAIDVALFHLALEARRAERRAPTRTVLVVDRRTIVDQAHQRAIKIRRALDSAKDGVVRRVRDALASLSTEGRALDVAILRGGIARDDGWLRSPSQPLVVLSTVDQVGSRFLFRGYGVSPTMQPIHAAMVGEDALLLLDEVHLSTPFLQTLEAVEERYGAWADQPLPRRWQLVSMSATGDGGGFRLDRRDAEHPSLRKRLQASKPAFLHEVTAAGSEDAKAEKFARTLADAAVSAANPGKAVAVVVNRVGTARRIFDRLRSSNANAWLLTGRMRAVDRAAVEERLFPRICAGRERSAGDRPVIVVATQCIEAGADLDFDVLLTECASLDALRQRFGRLNRLGAIADAHGSVFVRKDLLKADDPIYGSALRDTWAFLHERSGLDFGTTAFGDVRRDELDGLLAPRSRAPLLLPAHLDVWAQTSVHPEPEPDVALWLHGLDPVRPEVQIAWRADLSEALLCGAAAGDETAWAALLGRLELLPPISLETLSVPIGAARRWMAGQDAADFADVERSDPDDEQAFDGRLALVWKGDRSQVVGPRDLRPGDTLVVPASYGGLGPVTQEETGSGTWDPSSCSAVDDVAERVHLQTKGRRIVRLHPALVAGTASADAGGDGDVAEQTYRWLASHPQLGQLASDSLTAFRRRFRVLRLAGFADEPAYVALVSKRREQSDADETTTADDSSSFSGAAIALDSHLRGVGAMAGELARRAGLPEPIAADLELAGRFHDLGKIDPRFQMLLHGGSEFRAAAASEPLAKSAVPMSDKAARDLARERSRYPAGQRHELLSLALLDSEPALLARANDPELVRHLVASHHGHCRPLAPIQSDPAPVNVEYEVDGIRVGASSATEYHRLDSGVGDRFWTLTRRYGWWGLAWLETVLRLADHRRSEAEQMGTVE